MRALVWGVAFGVAGMACAALIVRDSVGEGWHVLRYTTGLAALLVAVLVCWLLVPPSGELSLTRGAAMGAFVTLLSYPVTWYLAILHQALFGGPSSLGDEPLGPISGLSGSLVFSFWSILLTGWWTAPLGAGLGALLALWDRGSGSAPIP